MTTNMYLPQITISFFLAMTPVLSLPPGFLHKGFPAPSLYPIEFNPVLSRRKSCAETCGTVCYYQSTIDKAVAEGYSLYQSGQTEGSDEYPHKYNDYEGFDFPVAGPYYEFPILHTFKAYDGGSPGPDRVIFNTNGDLAAVITHTGASGNDFVECDG
ncbi:ribonuclease T1 [Capronia coronata CBS 617.96]|uniref:ribonuclease T1 n=1 Tax=Capronia coronata CBS 617.96 TaxID=1182541 RepID=W9YDI6_9EURO|nr:ribonuclease T1 [Capronia coronata CBS 617.96]EXJ87745.1 ribonuclease T1 [Capronia coronata CBS 617.96]